MYSSQPRRESLLNVADARRLGPQIEHEEEMLLAEDPDAKVLHLCIVNLVIGTLYCSKANFEFGISRIMKSLEPYNKKVWPTYLLDPYEHTPSLSARR